MPPAAAAAGPAAGGAQGQPGQQQQQRGGFIQVGLPAGIVRDAGSSNALWLPAQRSPMHCCAWFAACRPCGCVCLSVLHPCFTPAAVQGLMRMLMMYYM